MSDNYNVDDILAEINSKRQKEERRNNPTAPHKKQDTGSVPFQLSGMTGEFQKAASEKKPDRKSYSEDRPRTYSRSVADERSHASSKKKTGYFDEDDLDFTLTMEIDTNSSERHLEYKDGKSVVLPKVREMNKQLNLERQEKIREFMANSDFENGFIDDDETGGFSFGDREKAEFKKSLGIKRNKKARDEDFSDEELSEEVFKKKKRRKKHNEDYPGDTLGQDFEFESASDVPMILEELAKRKKGCKIKLLATGIIFLLLLYLSLCNLYPLPLVSFLCPENNMMLFMFTNLFVFLLGAMVKSSDIGSGLLAFFTFRSDNDSPMALAFLAVALQGLYGALKSDYIYTGEAHLYFAVAGLILFMNSFGKLLTVKRVEKNFAVITQSKELRGEYMVEDSDLAASLSEGQGFDEANVAYSKRVKFPSDFISLSFSDNYFEHNGRILAPLFVLFGLIISLITLLLPDAGMNEAVTVFTVVMCMASPLTATIVAAMPLFKASNALSPDGIFVSGYNAVDKFEDTNGILLDARELYKQEDIILHGIKVFGDMRIDKSLVEAASLMYASNGLLKDVFLDTLEGDISMLKKVTDLRGYEGGLSGICRDTEVLMGSREFMERFNIDLPSREYERKFQRGDSRCIFLASNGSLSAMIVVSYKPCEEARDYLAKLEKYAPAVIVKSEDPNIDAKKIAEDFDYPEEYINMVREKNYAGVDEISRGTERARAYAMTGKSSGRLRLINALVALKKNITAATVFQMTGLIIGYAVVALMAFTGNFSMLGFLQIIIYQVFWAIVITIQGSLGKY